MLGALIVAAGLSTNAGAAAPTAKPGQLVIVASGGSHGLLTIKRATDLATADWSQTLPAGTVTSDSPYVGVQISKGHQVQFGFYIDHALASPVIFGQEHPRLAAGRYDITVISTRPVVIRLPITGSNRYTLKLSQRVAGARSEANAVPAPGVPLAFTSLATPITKTSTKLLIVTTTATAENASNTDLCLTTRQLPCAAGSADSGSGQGAAIINTAGSHEQVVLYVYPGDVPAGQYYATADQAVVGVQQTATLIVVTFGS
jgi:hypothetical protein